MVSYNSGWCCVYTLSTPWVAKQLRTSNCNNSSFSHCRRAFKPPTIFEARANRFLLPNKSPVRLLSPASDNMPFTMVCKFAAGLRCATNGGEK